jgi:hypothetical protein
VSTNALGSAGVDLAHRATGLVARARGVLQRRPVDDTVLVERVRAKLGRASSHPHAISVVSTDGVVRLRGPVLQSEIQRVIRTITHVSGVRRVLNELDAHSRRRPYSGAREPCLDEALGEGGACVADANRDGVATKLMYRRHRISRPIPHCGNDDLDDLGSLLPRTSFTRWRDVAVPRRWRGRARTPRGALP